VRPALFRARLPLAQAPLIVAAHARANDVADCFVKSGDSAIAACTRAIALHLATGPDLAKIYNTRAIERHDRVDYGGAITDYTEAINIDPGFTAAYTGRALTYQRIGDLGRAKEDYRRALSTPQNYNDGKWAHAMARTQLAGIYLVEGDLDSAIADYDEALRLEPKEGDAFETYMNRGLAWRAKGESDRAVADFSVAIKLDPKHAPSYVSRGLAWREQGDLDRVIEDCSEAIRLDPQYALGYVCRGYAYFSRSAFAAAAADFQQSAKLGDSPYALVWRYLARGRAGEDGAAELAAAVAAAREHPNGWSYRVIEVFLGRRQPGELLAAELRPEQRCLAQFYLGEWRLLRGDRDAAVAALRAAADSCPRDAVKYPGLVVDQSTFNEYLNAAAELKRLFP
jgi:tetratricopeptide (TPR) repeat protein